jgi:hypothetical protein
MGKPNLEALQHIIRTKRMPPGAYGHHLLLLQRTPMPECCLYRRFVFPATQLQCTALFRTTGTAYCSLLMSSADRQYFVSLQLHACMIAVDSQAVNEHLYTAQSWTKPRRGA